MSCFYGDPIDPFIGTCQNRIRGERTDWADSTYCGQPVIALGAKFATDRDICQTCREKSQAFTDRLQERYVAGVLAGTPEEVTAWVERSLALLVDMTHTYAGRAAGGAPVAELVTRRAEIERRERWIDAVLERAPVAGRV